MLVLLPLLIRWFFLFSIQMENNYSVYQHVTPDGDYYFGATNDIKRRWRNNGAEYKTTSLYPYIEKFGWDNIQHIILFENQSKENALWIEDFLITTAREDGVCINKQRSGLITKEEGYCQEYYKQNKEKFKEYNEQNKNKIREYQREYQREYKEQNKDKIREYNREYQRQYRQRKKLEKQLKEVETTLF